MRLVRRGIHQIDAPGVWDEAPSGIGLTKMRWEIFGRHVYGKIFGGRKKPSDKDIRRSAARLSHRTWGMVSRGRADPG